MHNMVQIILKLKTLLGDKEAKGTNRLRVMTVNTVRDHGIM